MLDENKDGRITREEMSRCIAGSNLGCPNMHNVEMSQEDWDRLISECDTDGDGSIEFEEFQRYLTTQLDEQLKKNSGVSQR